MCGICGGVGLSSRDALIEMAACLEHRGPNDLGTYVNDDAMLANQRLSIIDVAGGDQPIYSEDGDVVVVNNGEIYNFRELRDRLVDAGHTFSTDTDTEVLAHGYEEYGTEVFERLNGMFAAAIWDVDRRRLLLARDRVGIKPLYVASDDEWLLFGSEPKSVLRSGRVEPRVDRDALAYFLQLRFAPHHTSLFDGIETVQPGTYLDVSLDDGVDVSVHTYWSPAFGGSDPPSNPAAAVERALRNAVERQLVSDVPIGFYLSGGLDTSSVVAMAAQASDEPIRTFCMGFEDSQWDERRKARAVADHFGTDHHEVTIDRSFMEDFPKMIWYADEPKRNLYPYYVAEAMRDHVTVALGGLGADELFDGYIYRFARLRELDRLRSGLSPSARDTIVDTARTTTARQLTDGDLADDGLFEETQQLTHLDDDATLYLLSNNSDVMGTIDVLRTRVFGEGLQETVDPVTWIRDQRPPESTASLRERGLYWDFTLKLPDDFLHVEDRMSMAYGLESRVPFLDNELVDLALSIPASEKFDTDRSDVGKHVLRRAMRDRLPDTVFEHEKQGFTMPTTPFVRDELFDHAKSILDTPSIVTAGLVDGTYVRSLLERGPTAVATVHQKMLWKLVALEIWHQMYVVDDVSGPAAIESYYT
jgi:asparagine synthase (glutamine-hydrolysing)